MNNFKMIGATCALTVAAITTSLSAQAEVNSIQTHTAGRTVSVVDHQSVGRVLADTAAYGTKAASGFKWGRKDVHVESVDTSWAVNTSAESAGFKWGSRVQVIDNSVNYIADASSYTWSATSYAEQAGFQWAAKGFAEQAGFRWSAKSFAEQTGFRWGAKSFADQAGFRWGAKSFAEQAGFRWGANSFA